MESGTGKHEGRRELAHAKRGVCRTTPGAATTDNRAANRPGEPDGMKCRQMGDGIRYRRTGEAVESSWMAGEPGYSLYC